MEKQNELVDYILKVIRVFIEASGFGEKEHVILEEFMGRKKRDDVSFISLQHEG